jgi:transposase-like protein
MMTFTGHGSATIASHARFCRELVGQAIEDDGEMIGGPGMIVEIDESKFGKRKYHRGHRVEGVWVLGGVERTEERRLFVESVPDRTAATLLEVIERRVLPGSVIHTDMWRAYDGIQYVLGMEHRTVNHTIHFRDPETGVHTNTIEGTWNGIKIGMPRRNFGRDTVDGHLLEFIWRRKNQENMWDAMLNAMADVGYFEEE